MSQVDLLTLMENGSAGSRRFLANESDEDLPKARIYFQRLKYLDYFTKILLGYYVTNKVLSYFELSLY